MFTVLHHLFKQETHHMEVLTTSLNVCCDINVILLCLLFVCLHSFTQELICYCQMPLNSAANSCYQISLCRHSLMV